MTQANDSILVTPGSGATWAPTGRGKPGKFAGDRASYHRAYEAAQKPERKAQRDKLRADALAAYGGACACCGEARLVFLDIDHVNGNGTKHRQAVSNHTFRWLKKQGYPSGFRVLCRNCNWAEHRGGCPHNEVKP